MLYVVGGKDSKVSHMQKHAVNKISIILAGDLTLSLVMVLFFIVFFFFPKWIGDTNLSTFLWMFLAFSIGVIAVPFVEVLMLILEKPRASVGFAKIFAGLAGAAEAIVSLIALKKGDYTLYNLYNFNGLCIMLLVVVIAILVHLIFPPKKENSLN